MKILCTGAAGFIGSHIAELYIKNGHKVYIIDNLYTGTKQNLPEGSIFYQYDIRDKERISRLINIIKPDIINHHAAQSGVVKSLHDSQFDCDVNIMGLLNILNCYKFLEKKPKFIFSSSASIYGNDCNNKKETDKPDPQSFYAITKYASKRYIQTYSKIYNFDYTIFRYSCVTGLRQRPDLEAGVIAIFKNNLQNNKQCIIYNSGTQERDFVHVDDVAKANLLAIRELRMNIYNVSSGAIINIKDLYNKLKVQYKKDCDAIYSKVHRFGDAKIVSLNNKKLMMNGWIPMNNIDEILK